MANSESKFAALHLDIVLCVAKVTPTREINALSQTCRSLYETLNPIIYKRHAHDEHFCILTWAAKRGRVGTSRKALKAGADINEEEPFQDIEFAFRERSFLQTSGERDQAGSWSGQTALQIAVAQRHEALVRFLLNNGADPDVRGWDYLPLHLAAQYPPAPKLAKMLLDKGANVNGTTPDEGRTALHIAMRQKLRRGLRPNFEMVRLLLAHGANINARDEDGRTPKSMARKCEDHIRVLFDDQTAGHKLALYEAGIKDGSKKSGISDTKLAPQQALSSGSHSGEQKHEESSVPKSVKGTKREPAKVEDSFDWAAVRKRAMESEKQGKKRRSGKKSKNK